MARTKWQPTVTFVATNDNGHEHTLHVYTKWIEVVSMQEPPKWIEDAKEIRMDDGERVHRLEKGKYELATTHHLLRSDDPNAP